MEQTILVTEQTQKLNRLSFGEVSYYLFFLALLFAKGIGLYDGQKYFIPFLMAAYVFWAIKMCLTRYTVKEAVIIGVLFALGLLSYLNSGDKSALIAVMTVTGMKEVPVNRVFKFGCVMWIMTFVGAVTLALLDLWPTVQVVHNKGSLGYVIRNSLGMTHPNVLHISYMVLIAFLFLTFQWEGKAIIKPVILSLLGSLYIFMYSLSYTGFIFFIAYLILIIYFSLRKKISKFEKIVIQCLMPLCVIFALAGPVVLKGKIFDIVNKLMNTRFRLSRYYLTHVIPQLIGQEMFVDGGYSIDCSYVYCLYYYGILLFIFFMLGIFYLIRNLLKQERRTELAVVLGQVAAGFTEPFLFTFAFKNLIFPLLGEYFFLVLEKRKFTGKLSFLERRFQLVKLEKDLPNFPEAWIDFGVSYAKRALANKGKLLLIGAIAGLLAGAVVSNFIPEPEPYVVVNKDTSDRVGGRNDYLIYSELDQEIIDNSIKLNIYEEDAKVYVFSGSTVEYEGFRNKVSVIVYGGLIGWLLTAAVSCIVFSRKNSGRKEASVC